MSSASVSSGLRRLRSNTSFAPVLLNYRNNRYFEIWLTVALFLEVFALWLVMNDAYLWITTNFLYFCLYFGAIHKWSTYDSLSSIVYQNNLIKADFTAYNVISDDFFYFYDISHLHFILLASGHYNSKSTCSSRFCRLFYFIYSHSLNSI